MVVSANRLGLKELLTKRAVSFEKRFPNSKKVPYFLIWAADVSEGEEKASYLERAAEHPTSTNELSQAAQETLDSMRPGREYQDIFAPVERGLSWTTIIMANVMIIAAIVILLIIIRRRRLHS